MNLNDPWVLLEAIEKLLELGEVFDLKLKLDLAHHVCIDIGVSLMNIGSRFCNRCSDFAKYALPVSAVDANEGRVVVLLGLGFGIVMPGDGDASMGV